MFDSLSKIIGTALLKLGDYAQWVSSNELETVAFDRLAYYLEDLRESDQNQKLKTLNFDLVVNTNEVNLKTLANDIHTAAWVEVRLDRNQTFQEWQYVPTVNLDVIPEYRARGLMVCAFYGGDIDELKVMFSYYGDSRLSAHRLRYDPNIALPDDVGTAIKLPNNLGNVIMHDILAEIVTCARLRMLEMLSEDPLLKEKLSALEQIRTDAIARKTEWWEKWNNFKQNANRSQRGTIRRKYLPKIGL